MPVYKSTNEKSFFDLSEGVVCVCDVIMYKEAWFIISRNVNAIVKQILTSHGCYCSECFAAVEHNSTVANYLL